MPQLEPVAFRVDGPAETAIRLLLHLRVDFGAEVDAKVQEEPYGRFGWAVDPEGNRFELWQPAAAD